MFNKPFNPPSYLIILLILVAGFMGIIYFSIKIKPKTLSSNRQQPAALASLVPSPTASSNQSTVISLSPSSQNRQENRLSEKGIGFDLNVIEPKIRSLSALQFKFSNEANTELVKSFEIRIPAGWEFTKGEVVGRDAIVGKAVLNMIVNDKPQVAEAQVLNDQDTQGHKARFIVVLLGSKFDVFVDQKEEGSHSITMERSVIEGIKPPSSIEVTIFSEIFKGPDSAGDYSFEASAKLFDESILQFRKTISLN